jgi:hypothetical protein
MEKMREGLPEGNHAMATLLAEKNPSEKTEHAPRGAKVCKGLGCRNKFFPKRRKQVFCSPKCRLSYFATAREIGIFLLEGMDCNPGLRVGLHKLLKFLKELGELPIDISKSDV